MWASATGAVQGSCFKQIVGRTGDRSWLKADSASQCVSHEKAEWGSMLRHFPDTTKIVFFDLEYFVPQESRERKAPGGMKFSPLLPGHRILGGTFQTYLPMLDQLEPAKQIWEWRAGSERAVLQQILDLLKGEWRNIEKKPDLGSLMLCGIGISHSDVPALAAKMIAYELESPVRIHDLLYGCRQIDLTTATYCQFSFNTAYFSYPKSKAHLYHKYLGAKSLEPGTAVWQNFEAGNFNAIEARTLSEVWDSVAIYKQMVVTKKQEDRKLARLKKLEKLLPPPHFTGGNPLSGADGDPAGS